MAELAALISWLTAFYLFAIEWDEDRDGGELSVQLEPYIRMAQKAWTSTVLIFNRAKSTSKRRSSVPREDGDSTLDPWN